MTAPRQPAARFWCAVGRDGNGLMILHEAHYYGHACPYGPETAWYGPETDDIRCLERVKCGAQSAGCWRPEREN